MAKATFYRFSGGGTFQNYHTAKLYAQQHANDTGRSVVIEYAKGGKAWKKYRTIPAKRKNPGVSIRGWVKAKAVKIVRNKRGQAVSVKIKT